MRILAVCLGNYCRSPAAEAALRRHGPDLTVDSAGTADYHVGTPPHMDMQRAARRLGLDLSPLRGRQVRLADFDDFDLILAMDRANMADLRRIRPLGSRADLRLMTSALPDDQRNCDVPDPYHTGDFDGVTALIDRAARAIAAEVSGRPARPGR